MGARTVSKPKKLFCDIETFSRTDVKKGVYRYAEIGRAHV